MPIEFDAEDLRSIGEQYLGGAFNASPSEDMDMDPAAGEPSGGSPKGQKPRDPNRDMATRIAQANKVRPQIIHAMMSKESSGNPKAKSWSGNLGLMQVSQDVFSKYGIPGRDITDPEANITAGVRYYKHLLDMFGGDEKRALAAYNAGPDLVKKAGNDWWNKSQYWSNDKEVQAGRKPRGASDPTNTQNYVKHIWSNAQGGKTYTGGLYTFDPESLRKVGEMFLSGQIEKPGLDKGTLGQVGQQYLDAQNKATQDATGYDPSRFDVSGLQPVGDSPLAGAYQQALQNSITAPAAAKGSAPPRRNPAQPAQGRVQQPVPPTQQPTEAELPTIPGDGSTYDLPVDKTQPVRRLPLIDSPVDPLKGQRPGAPDAPAVPEQVDEKEFQAWRSYLKLPDTVQNRNRFAADVRLSDKASYGKVLDDVGVQQTDVNMSDGSIVTPKAGGPISALPVTADPLKGQSLTPHAGQPRTIVTGRVHTGDPLKGTPARFDVGNITDPTLATKYALVAAGRPYGITEQTVDQYMARGSGKLDRGGTLKPGNYIVTPGSVIAEMKALQDNISQEEANKQISTDMRIEQANSSYETPATDATAEANATHVGKDWAKQDGEWIQNNLRITNPFGLGDTKPGEGPLPEWLDKAPATIVGGILRGGGNTADFIGGTVRGAKNAMLAGLTGGYTTNEKSWLEDQMGGISQATTSFMDAASPKYWDAATKSYKTTMGTKLLQAGGMATSDIGRLATLSYVGGPLGAYFAFPADAMAQEYNHSDDLYAIGRTGVKQLITAGLFHGVGVLSKAGAFGENTVSKLIGETGAIAAGTEIIGRNYEDDEEHRLDSIVTNVLFHLHGKVGEMKPGQKLVGALIRARGKGGIEKDYTVAEDGTVGEIPVQNGKKPDIAIDATEPPPPPAAGAVPELKPADPAFQNNPVPETNGALDAQATAAADPGQTSRVGVLYPKGDRRAPKKGNAQEYRIVLPNGDVVMVDKRGWAAKAPEVGESADKNGLIRYTKGGANQERVQELLGRVENVPDTRGTTVVEATKDGQQVDAAAVTTPENAGKQEESFKEQYGPDVETNVTSSDQVVENRLNDHAAEQPVRMTKDQILGSIDRLHSAADVEAARQLMPEGEYEVKEIPLKGLKFLGKGDDAKIARYVKQGKENGEQGPSIVVNGDGTVVDGKHRAKAAIIRGEKSIKAWVPVGKEGVPERGFEISSKGEPKATTPEGKLKQQRDEARRQAETDPLTKVGNRSALDRALPSAEADPNMSVLSFDANNFGKINKGYGEQAGDEHIKMIANALVQASAEHGSRVFRKGGDEFVIIAPKAEAEAIRQRAEELYGEHEFEGFKAANPDGSRYMEPDFKVSISGSHGDTFEEANSKLQDAKAARKAELSKKQSDDSSESPKEKPAKNLIPDSMFEGTNLEVDFNHYIENGKAPLGKKQTDTFNALSKKVRKFFQDKYQHRKDDYEKAFSANERHLIEREGIVKFWREAPPHMVMPDGNHKFWRPEAATTEKPAEIGTKSGDTREPWEMTQAEYEQQQTLTHGTTPENAESIHQNGFSADALTPERRQYPYSEMGPDTVYAAEDGTIWFDQQIIEQRGKSYPTKVPVVLDPSAKVFEVDNPAKITELAKIAGYKDVKKFLDDWFVDGLDSHEPGFKKHIDAARKISERIKAAGYDAVRVAHGIEDLSHSQLAVLRPEKLLTAKEAHRRAVAEAIKAGKLVPENVLTEYFKNPIEEAKKANGTKTGPVNDKVKTGVPFPSGEKKAPIRKFDNDAIGTDIYEGEASAVAMKNSEGKGWTVSYYDDGKKIHEVQASTKRQAENLLGSFHRFIEGARLQNAEVKAARKEIGATDSDTARAGAVADKSELRQAGQLKKDFDSLANYKPNQKELDNAYWQWRNKQASSGEPMSAADREYLTKRLIDFKRNEIADQYIELTGIKMMINRDSVLTREEALADLESGRFSPYETAEPKTGEIADKPKEPTVDPAAQKKARLDEIQASFDELFTNQFDERYIEGRWGGEVSRLQETNPEYRGRSMMDVADGHFIGPELNSIAYDYAQEAGISLKDASDILMHKHSYATPEKVPVPGSMSQSEPAPEPIRPGVGDSRAAELEREFKEIADTPPEEYKAQTFGKEYEGDAEEIQDNALHNVADRYSKLKGIDHDDALSALNLMHGYLDPRAPFGDSSHKSVDPQKILAMPSVGEPPKEAPAQTPAEANKTKKSKQTTLSAEKAYEKLDDWMTIAPDITKKQVITYAEKMHKAGLLGEGELAALKQMAKDRDLGSEDLIYELKSSAEYAMEKDAKGEDMPAPEVTTGNQQPTTADVSGNAIEPPADPTHDYKVGETVYLKNGKEVTVVDVKPDSLSLYDYDSMSEYDAVNPKAVSRSNPGEAGFATLDFLTLGTANVIRKVAEMLKTPITKFRQHGDDLAQAAVSHAYARLAAIHETRDLLAKVFPDQYLDKDAMGRTIRIMNLDNILGGYDEFRFREAREEGYRLMAVAAGDPARAAIHERARDGWRNKAVQVESAHDIAALDAEVRSATSDPEISANIDRWTTHVNPRLNDLYARVKAVNVADVSDGRGRIFGARLNLLPKVREAEMLKYAAPGQPPPEPSASNYRNPNVKRDRYDRSAAFTGDYSESAEAVLLNALGPRLNEATKLDFYDQLVASGQAHWADAAGNKPAGVGDEFKLMMVKLPETNPDGYTRQVETPMWVHEKMVQPVRGVLNTDMVQQMHPVAEWLTSLQMAQFVDAAAHIKNIHTVLAYAPATAMSLVNAVRRMPGVGSATTIKMMRDASKAIAEDSPAIREKLADMAAQGMLRPEHEHKGFSNATGMGKVITKADTAARVVMYDLFNKQVAAGMAEDTPMNRRQFVQQVGEYNARLLGPGTNFLKRWGASPFVVAGTTFNKMAVKMLMGSPGFKARDASAAVKLRAANLLGGIVASAVVPMMLNLATTGSIQGRPGTPIGAWDLGWEPDEKGKHSVIDIMALQGYRRGLRMTGVNAILAGLQSGDDANSVIWSAFNESLSTAGHPWIGPAPGFAMQALTGRKFDLRGGPEPAEPRNFGPNGTQITENFRVALKNINPLVYSIVSGAIGTPEEKEDSFAQRLLEGIFKGPLQAAGYREVASPATKKMDELARMRGTFTRDPKNDVSRATAKDLIKRADAGEDVTRQIVEAVDSGKMTIKEVGRLQDNLHLSPTALKFKYMNGSVPEILQVWEMMSDKEKEESWGVMAGKIAKGYSNGSFTPNEVETLKNMGWDENSLLTLAKAGSAKQDKNRSIFDAAQSLKLGQKPDMTDLSRTERKNVIKEAAFNEDQQDFDSAPIEQKAFIFSNTQDVAKRAEYAAILRAAVVSLQRKKQKTPAEFGVLSLAAKQLAEYQRQKGSLDPETRKSVAQAESKVASVVMRRMSR